MKLKDALGFFLLLLFSFVFYIIFTNYNLDLFRYDKFNISTDFFRYFVSFVVLLLTIIIIKRYSVGNNLIFVPTLSFSFLFFIMVYPGVIITAPENYYGNIAAYGYILSIIPFDIGVILASKIYKFCPKQEIDEFYAKSNNIRRLDNVEKLWIFIVTIISITIVIMTIGIDSSGMLKGIISFLSKGLVPEEAMNVREARLSIYASGIDIIRIVSNYIVMLILPIVTMTIIINSLVNSKKYSKIGVVLLIFTSLANIGTGQRRLIGYLILYIIISLSFIYRLKLKRIIKYFALLFAIYILQTITLGRMQGGENYLENLIMSFHRVFERVFLTKGGTSVHVFGYFPEISDFKYGSTYFQKLLGSFSNEISLANEMHYYIYGKAGTAGPQAFGEAYANFGFWGMIIISLIIGVLVQSISVVIIRKKLFTSNSIAICAFLSLLFGLIGYSDFMVVKANGIHVLAIYVLSQKLFIKIIRKT